MFLREIKNKDLPVEKVQLLLAIIVGQEKNKYSDKQANARFQSLPNVIVKDVSTDQLRTMSSESIRNYKGILSQCYKIVQLCYNKLKAHQQLTIKENEELKKAKRFINNREMASNLCSVILTLLRNPLIPSHATIKGNVEKQTLLDYGLLHTNSNVDSKQHNVTIITKQKDYVYAIIEMLARDDMEHMSYYLLTTSCFKEEIKNEFQRRQKAVAIPPGGIEAAAEKHYNRFREVCYWHHVTPFKYRGNATDNPMGWFINAIEFFEKSESGFHSNIYTNLAYEVSLDSEVAGSAKQDATPDPTVVEINPVEIDFSECISKIAQASVRMYKVSAKDGADAENVIGDSLVLSDIFTYHVWKEKETAVDEFIKNLYKRVGKKGRKYYKLENNSSDTDGPQNRKTKLNAKNMLSELFSEVVRNGIDVRNISRLYRKCIAEFNNAARGNGVAASSNGVNPFHTYGASVRSDSQSGYVANADFFMTYLEGHAALHLLLKHIKESGYVGGDPINFPPTVFYDLKYPRRFHSLLEYLQLGPKFFSIIKEGNSSDVLLEEAEDSVLERVSSELANRKDGLIKSDDLYDMFAIDHALNAKTNVIFFLFQKCTIRDVEEAFYVVNEKSKGSDFVSTFTQANRFYSNFLSPFYLSFRSGEHPKDWLFIRGTEKASTVRQYLSKCDKRLLHPNSEFASKCLSLPDEGNRVLRTLSLLDDSSYLNNRKICVLNSVSEDADGNTVTSVYRENAVGLSVLRDENVSYYNFSYYENRAIKEDEQEYKILFSRSDGKNFPYYNDGKESHWLTPAQMGFSITEEMLDSYSKHSEFKRFATWIEEDLGQYCIHYCDQNGVTLLIMSDENGTPFLWHSSTGKPFVSEEYTNPSIVWNLDTICWVNGEYASYSTTIQGASLILNPSALDQGDKVKQLYSQSVPNPETGGEFEYLYFVINKERVYLNDVVPRCEVNRNQTGFDYYFIEYKEESIVDTENNYEVGWQLYSEVTQVVMDKSVAPFKCYPSIYSAPTISGDICDPQIHNAVIALSEDVAAEKSLGAYGTGKKFRFVNEQWLNQLSFSCADSDMYGFENTVTKHFDLEYAPEFLLFTPYQTNYLFRRNHALVSTVSMLGLRQMTNREVMRYLQKRTEEAGFRSILDTSTMDEETLNRRVSGGGEIPFYDQIYTGDFRDYAYVAVRNRNIEDTSMDIDFTALSHCMSYNVNEYLEMITGGLLDKPDSSLYQILYFTQQLIEKRFTSDTFLFREEGGDSSFDESADEEEELEVFGSTEEEKQCINPRSYKSFLFYDGYMNYALNAILPTEPLDLLANPSANSYYFTSKQDVQKYRDKLSCTEGIGKDKVKANRDLNHWEMDIKIKTTFINTVFSIVDIRHANGFSDLQVLSEDHSHVKLTDRNSFRLEQLFLFLLSDGDQFFSSFDFIDFYEEYKTVNLNEVLCTDTFDDTPFDFTPYVPEGMDEQVLQERIRFIHRCVNAVKSCYLSLCPLGSVVDNRVIGLESSDSYAAKNDFEVVIMLANAVSFILTYYDSVKTFVGEMSGAINPLVSKDLLIGQDRERVDKVHLRNTNTIIIQATGYLDIIDLICDSEDKDYNDLQNAVHFGFSCITPEFSHVDAQENAQLIRSIRDMVVDLYHSIARLDTDLIALLSELRDSIGRRFNTKNSAYRSKTAGVAVNEHLKVYLNNQAAYIMNNILVTNYTSGDSLLRYAVESRLKSIAKNSLDTNGYVRIGNQLYSRIRPNGNKEYLYGKGFFVEYDGISTEAKPSLIHKVTEIELKEIINFLSE